MNSFDPIIVLLQRKLDHTENKKLYKSLEWYKRAFQALIEKEVLSDKLLSIITQLEAALQLGDLSRKELGKIRREFISILEKDYGLVCHGHYQQKWMMYGIMFGLPFGVVFSTMLNNYAFIGIGLPIGIGIGLALGTEKDNKPAAEGRVLDIPL